MGTQPGPCPEGQQGRGHRVSSWSFLSPKNPDLLQAGVLVLAALICWNAECPAKATFPAAPCFTELTKYHLWVINTHGKELWFSLPSPTINELFVPSPQCCCCCSYIIFLTLTLPMGCCVGEETWQGGTSSLLGQLCCSFITFS